MRKIFYNQGLFEPSVKAGNSVIDIVVLLLLLLKQGVLPPPPPWVHGIEFRFIEIPSRHLPAQSLQ